MSENGVQQSMKALVQLESGYSRDRSSHGLETVEPYLKLAEIPVPQPRDGQALIKVTMASVNPSDVAFIKGQYGQPRKQGVPAGFEGVGTVIKGEGASAGLEGKRVAFMGSISGAWAEYAIADAAYCIPLADGIRDEDGAAMIVNPMTAIDMFGIVRDEGANAFVLTAAASQLCKFIIGLAREEGYRPIAIVRRDEQIDILKQHGAAHVLNQTAPDFAEKLRAVFKEEEPRIMLDAVAGTTGSDVFDAMGRDARWIIYGRLDETPPVIREPGQLIFLNKKIEGYWLSQRLRESDDKRRTEIAVKAQENFIKGVWKTDVTEHLTLEEAMERLPKSLAVPNGKVFITP